MGICIECLSTGSSINIGYGHFAVFRQKIADLVDKDFSEHYKKLIKPFWRSDKEWEEYDKITEKFVRKRLCSTWVIRFLYAADYDGHLPWSACKKLLEFIEPLNNKEEIGYCSYRVGAATTGPATIGDFKNILEECVKNKCNMEWH